MGWIAHFHGGPADGQHFDVPREPLMGVHMENIFVDRDGTLHYEVYSYLRTKLTDQVAIYHLSDIQTASRKESDDPANLD